MKGVQTNLMDKDIKNKVGKIIDSILNKSRMQRKEFEEVKGIALEMKASGQTKLLTHTPIAMEKPTEELTVAQIVRKHLQCHIQ